MTLVAGIDSSTQSCKVLVCDADTGEVVREGRAGHPDGTEISPAAWESAAQSAISSAGGFDDVDAVAVGAQQHGMVCLDGTGQVVRPALLWNDVRSADAAASSSCWPGVVLPGLVVVAIAARYKGYRYPIEIIGHAVWLYHRFALSLRDVEELMVARGVVVTYETIRSWCAKFGPDYANQLRQRRPGPGDKWHLDEVFVKINGTTHYLWRAVDQHGDVLDILVQSRRNAVAAKRFFRVHPENWWLIM